MKRLARPGPQQVELRVAHRTAGRHCLAAAGGGSVCASMKPGDSGCQAPAAASRLSGRARRARGYEGTLLRSTQRRGRRVPAWLVAVVATLALHAPPYAHAGSLTAGRGEVFHSALDRRGGAPPRSNATSRGVATSAGTLRSGGATLPPDGRVALSGTQARPRPTVPRLGSLVAANVTTAAPTPVPSTAPTALASPCAGLTGAAMCANVSACSAHVDASPLISQGSQCCTGGELGCLRCAAVMGCTSVYPYCLDSTWTQLGVTKSGLVVPMPCADSPGPFVTSSGASVTCAQLKPDCGEPSVVQLCPSTCGACAGVVAANCPALKPHCNKSAVSRACPLTCDVCNPSHATTAAPTAPSSAATPPPTQAPSIQQGCGLDGPTYGAELTPGMAPNTGFWGRAVNCQSDLVCPPIVYGFCSGENVSAAEMNTVGTVVASHPSVYAIFASGAVLPHAPNFTAPGVVSVLIRTSSGFTRVDDGAFGGMPSLSAVAITSSGLTYVGSSAFAGMGRWRGITSVPWDEGFVYVLLNNNAITVAPKLNGVANLKVLDLSYNMIASVPSNQFSGVESLCPSDSTIDLGNNQITVVEAGAFTGDGIASLQRLYLQNNQITLIGDGAFAGLTDLMTLLLSYNRLSSVHATVFAGMNFTQQLADVLSCGRRFKYPIQFHGGTQVSENDDAMVASMELVASKLDMSANNLTAVAFPEGFATTLCLLDLSSNRLTSVSLADFSSLTEVSLQGNALAGLQNGSLPTTLGKLTLIPNPITFVESGAFAGLHGVGGLQLQASGLLSMPRGALSDLISAWSTPLASLVLSPNPLTCRSTPAPSRNNLLPAFDIVDGSPTGSASHGPLCELTDNGACFVVNPGPAVPKSGQCTISTTSAFQLSAPVVNDASDMWITQLAAMCTGGDTTSPSSQALCAGYIQVDNKIFVRPSSVAGVAVAAGAIINVVAQSNYFMAFPGGNAPVYKICSSTAQPFDPSLLVCDTCQLGYVFDNTTASCLLPPFGPRSGWSPEEQSSQFAPPPGQQRALLWANETYRASPSPLVPLDTAFHGYTNGDYGAIRYELSFAHTGVDIGCGTAVDGDTAGRRNLYFYNNSYLDGPWPDPTGAEGQQCNAVVTEAFAAEGRAAASSASSTPWCTYCTAGQPSSNTTVVTSRCARGGMDGAIYTGPCNSPSRPACPYLFNSPDAHFRFRLLTPGSVTFSTCESAFATSIAVYNATGQVWPTVSTLMVGNGPIVNQRQAGPFPATGGCVFSLAANVSVNLTAPGDYTVVVDGALMWDQGMVEKYGVVPTEGFFNLDMQCSNGATSESPGTGSPGGISVNPITGAIVGTPELPGNYSMNLTAVDGNGSRATIQQWAFDVRRRGQFGLRPGAAFAFQPPVPPIIAVNETYQFATPTSIAAGSPGKTAASANAHLFDNYTAPIHFQLTPVAGTAPPQGDFLISSTSGLMLVHPTAEFNTSLELTAVDAMGGTLLLERRAIQALVPDTKLCSYGPNGKCCMHGGVPVDPVPFDHAYTCACTAPYSGPNCESIAAGASNRDRVVMWAVVASVTAVAAFAVLAAWVKFKRARLQATTDFSAIQRDLLNEFGVAVAFDIQSDEIGLLLVVEGLPEDESTGTATLPDDAAQDLRQLLQRQVGFGIDWDGAVLRLSDPLRGHVTVIVKRPPQMCSSDAGDNLVRRIKRAVASPRGVTFGDVDVVEVSLLVPRRVPREVDRSTVLRLEQLGAGVSSTVYKAQLTPKRGIAPPLLVACKEPRSTSWASQEVIEKEATLLAMLDGHPNVIKVVGAVVRTAKLPSLILLEYCENGPLDHYCRCAATSEVPLSTMVRLSFCADIAAGLEYLSSRSIVHRDVAARNVLLDAAFTCKVADLGMSCVLSKSGGDDDDDNSALLSEYRKTYVRIHGELPVRWAALEVLTDNRFSMASDVWAFGVCAWEVFADGERPFGEIASLDLVAEHIKAGNTLGSPDACPKLVYDSVMRPCWHPHHEARPGFAELHRATVDLGGQVTSVLRGGGGGGLGGVQRVVLSNADPLSDNTRYPPEYWRSPAGLRLRGVSVHHMVTVLEPTTVAATRRPFAVNGRTVAPPAVCDITIEHLVHSVVLPQCAGLPCPRDGGVGCAYVDSLCGEDHVGPSSALLSYSWQYSVADVVGALSDWTESRGRDAARTYVWVCALCLNQHRMAKTLSPATLAAEFGPRVTQIGRLLSLLAPWDAPVYVTRAWCLFEIFTAIRNRLRVEINIVFPPSQKDAFAADMAAGRYAALDDILSSVDGVAAEATEEDDLTAIRAFINELPGGFDTLNATIRDHLRKWLRQQGAVMAAPRASLRRYSSTGVAGVAMRDSSGGSTGSSEVWLSAVNARPKRRRSGGEGGSDSGAPGPSALRAAASTPVHHYEGDDDVDDDVNLIELGPVAAASAGGAGNGYVALRLGAETLAADGDASERPVGVRMSDTSL